MTGLEPRVRSAVLEGGQDISNQYNLGSFGTLGVVLLSKGVPTALSCAHVMVSAPPSLGQGVIEPSGPNGGTWPASSIGTVSLADYGPSNVDAALVPISGRASNVGAVAGIGQITGTGAAAVSQPVRKRGARTGYTEGIVSSTTLTWSYTDPGLGGITLKNQIRVDNYGGTVFGLQGDSGSAVIDANFHMVGMIVSGDPGNFTVCNPSSDLVNIIPPLMSFSKKE